MPDNTDNRATPRRWIKPSVLLPLFFFLLVVALLTALFACGHQQPFQPSGLSSDLSSSSSGNASNQTNLTPEETCHQTSDLPTDSIPSYSVTSSGTLQNPRLDELSGLASSGLQDNLFWGHNDSGNKPVLSALNKDGKNSGSLVLVGAKNIDWEDIGRFQWRGAPWLMVADVGDNGRDRDRVSLYFLKEPRLPAGAGSESAAPVAIDQWYKLNFRYPDGPQNVEAVAISCTEQKIYLIGKNAPHTLYTLPLDFESGDTLVTAKAVGRLQPLLANANDNALVIALAGKMLLQPTALDFSDDGRYAFVLNYRHGYVFQRHNNESWATALRSKPIQVLDHELEQAEAASFMPGSHDILYGSEGKYGELDIAQTISPEPGREEMPVEVTAPSGVVIQEN
ncbi:MAG: hypothetical protein ACWA5X_00855 [bacterium]